MHCSKTYSTTNTQNQRRKGVDTYVNCRYMTQCTDSKLNLILKTNSKQSELLDFNNYMNSSKRDYRKDYSHNCWKCGTELEPVQQQYFCGCGVVQPPNRDRHYFDVLDMPVCFNLNETKMSDNYKSLQKKLHPDKFSKKSKVRRILYHLLIINSFCSIDAFCQLFRLAINAF